jgi:lipopolysaccharide biosynthesis regulator YciM
LIEAYAEEGKLQDAKKLVQTTISEFSGTSEEVRVLIMNANLNLKAGEIKAAINILKTLKKESPNFVKAKIKMADI